MHEKSLVIAKPKGADRLVLLFHGVGSSASHLIPLGQRVALGSAGAMVVSVNAPQPSNSGGHEWFSVIGITEQNRPTRIAEAMPLFLESVQYWCQRGCVDPQRVTLIGFSQGAIMALEFTQLESAPRPSRVVALAGRFALPVRRAPEGLQYHLIHGAQDTVVSSKFAEQAAHGISANGGGVTLDVLDGLGHSIDARALDLLLNYLR